MGGAETTGESVGRALLDVPQAPPVMATRASGAGRSGGSRSGGTGSDVVGREEGGRNLGQ